MDCPFCPIQRKTDWYFHDVIYQVVACEDLNPRGYKYRILVVGSGPRWHQPWEEYENWERNLLWWLVNFIGRYHIEIGKAKRLVEIDTEHFSIKGHGHCQACMR